MGFETIPLKTPPTLSLKQQSTPCIQGVTKVSELRYIYVQMKQQTSWLLF